MFEGNVSGGSGGAIAMRRDFCASTVTVDSSTFSGNTADGVGGAIENEFGVLTVTNSTFSDNTASDGGGIYNWGTGGGPDGTVDVVNSTIAENSPATSSPVVASSNNNDGTFTITNSIVANNYGNDGIDANCVNYGTWSPDSNLSTDATCPGFAIGDPGLGPLRDNGGPTATHALTPGSPAIDAGSHELLSGRGSTGRCTDRRLRSRRVRIRQREPRGCRVTVLPDSSISDSAISANDPNWYRIAVPVAGSTLTATMTSAADYDIFLFAPRVEEESGQLRDLGQIANIGPVGQHRPARQHRAVG